MLVKIRSMPSKAQRGFTLVELMIGLVVGLIIMGGVLAAFIAVLQQNTQTLRMTKLNQELRGAMDMIVSDMKRAGFSAGARDWAGDRDYYEDTSSVNFPGLDVANASCILFRFDRDQEGDLDTTGPDERFGYRLNDNAIEVRRDGTDCAGDGWEAITDDQAIQVTALNFAETENCFEHDQVDLKDGVTVIDTNHTMVREITVTMTGQLVSDASVTRTLTQAVRLRNDHIKSGACPP